MESAVSLRRRPRSATRDQGVRAMPPHRRDEGGPCVRGARPDGPARGRAARLGLIAREGAPPPNPHRDASRAPASNRELAVAGVRLTAHRQALPKRASEIAVQFNRSPHLGVPPIPGDSLAEPNLLVLAHPADEGMSRVLRAKLPGPLRSSRWRWSSTTAEVRRRSRPRLRAPAHRRELRATRTSTRG